MLTDRELQRRQPLWTALSELWLDIELTSADIERIAAAAIASGYSVEELSQIYLEEVAPVVYPNLLTPAGVWTGFDEAWLHQEARKRADSRTRKPYFLNRIRWGRKLMTYATDCYWQQILAQVQSAYAA